MAAGQRQELWWWRRAWDRQLWEEMGRRDLRGNQVRGIATGQPRGEAKGCVRSLYHRCLSLRRLVSSVQAVMASTAGYIVSTSCKHIIDDQ